MFDVFAMGGGGLGLRWVAFFEMVGERKILLYNSDPKIPQGFSEISLYNSEWEIHGEYS